MKRIDHLEFARLCAEAESAKANGWIDVGLNRFERALSLWRGGAFDGLDVPAFAPHAAALEERRDRAIEDYFELSIGIGRGSATIPHLLLHVGAHPLRERAVAPLMTALYREGRTHDDHAVYARLVDRLRSELSVEPGVEIRRTFDAMLAGAI